MQMQKVAFCASAICWEAGLTESYWENDTNNRSLLQFALGMLKPFIFRNR